MARRRLPWPPYLPAVLREHEQQLGRSLRYLRGLLLPPARCVHARRLPLEPGRQHVWCVKQAPAQRYRLAPQSHPFGCSDSHRPPCLLACLLIGSLAPAVAPLPTKVSLRVGLACCLTVLTRLSALALACSACSSLPSGPSSSPSHSTNPPQHHAVLLCHLLVPICSRPLLARGRSVRYIHCLTNRTLTGSASSTSTIRSRPVLS